jgi:hypothetical protein
LEAEVVMIKRPRGETTALVRERLRSARLFEDAFIGNLERKLACGALRPEIAALVRKEIALRGEKSKQPTAEIKIGH